MVLINTNLSSENFHDKFLLFLLCFRNRKRWEVPWVKQERQRQQNPPARTDTHNVCVRSCMDKASKRLTFMALLNKVVYCMIQEAPYPLSFFLGASWPSVVNGVGLQASMDLFGSCPSDELSSLLLLKTLSGIDIIFRLCMQIAIGPIQKWHLNAQTVSDRASDEVVERQQKRHLIQLKFRLRVRLKLTIGIKTQLKAIKEKTRGICLGMRDAKRADYVSKTSIDLLTFAGKFGLCLW